jgi:predicted glutamine amidotransferase
MCGIVGIAGDLYFKEEKTMQSLLLLDYFRGPDSTGLAAVRNNGDVKIAKLANDPITLFQMPKFKDALNGNNSKLFLGHNRASTSGATNNFNAHPYHFGHIVGVQNGTLEFKDKSLLEEVVGEKFEVDSQALYSCIAKIGIKDTIEMIHEGEDSQRGAWSLVWYDMKEDTVNFLRNKHRPMWLAWDQDFKRLFFASRYEMIAHATDIADPKYNLEEFERVDEKGSFYRFFSLPENQHVKFNLEEMKKGAKERPKPIAKAIKGKEPVKSSFKPSFQWDPFQKAGKAKSTQQTLGSTTTSPRGTNRQGEGLFHLFSTPESPYCDVLGAARFAELIQAGSKGNQVGCSYCYKDIAYGDSITVYEQQDTILCSTCSGFDGDERAPLARIYVSPPDFKALQEAA